MAYFELGDRVHDCRDRTDSLLGTVMAKGWVYRDHVHREKQILVRWDAGDVERYTGFELSPIEVIP